MEKTTIHTMHYNDRNEFWEYFGRPVSEVKVGGGYVRFKTVGGQTRYGRNVRSHITGWLEFRPCRRADVVVMHADASEHADELTDALRQADVPLLGTIVDGHRLMIRLPMSRIDAIQDTVKEMAAKWTVKYPGLAVIYDWLGA